MKFLKLDKKKGSGGPSIKSRFAYLILIDDIASFPVTNEKGVRLVGDIVLKDECTMMPLYLTNSSQEFSYETLGDDDEKNYKVKFSGNHPGTELEALEFAKNMIEQPYLVLIPGCNTSEPWKLLGEIDNPLIFTSSHKASKDGSKFTFNFEQRIGSEFIYFSYGGVEVPSGEYGTDPPSGGFDPSKWARIDASNIDPYIAEWRDKLGINSGSIKNYPTFADFPIPGDITTIYKALDTDELFVWDAETGTYLLSSIDDSWKNYVELSIGGLQTSIDGINEELVTIESRLDDLDDNDNSLQEQITAETTARQNADNAESNARTFADGVLDGKIKAEKNRNDTQDLEIATKVDKPTTDGTWVVTKSGSTISYTDASTLGQNISNANLTWTVDRVQNLNGKKLSFTNGRFSVPTLEMEVTSSNSVPNKIWTDGVNEYYTNNAGINYKVGFDGDCTCVIITSVNISTSTLEAVTNKSQHGRNVILSNGVNAINLTCEITSDSKFVASYTKLGSAAITFTAGSGATLVQVDGTAILNGAVGSTACLTRSGNTFYLQISNR